MQVKKILEIRSAWISGLREELERVRTCKLTIMAAQC
jgi:hypothetical protein